MKKHLLYLTIFTLFFICKISYSADVLVHVNGKIINESCDIDSNDLIKNVTLEDVYAQQFIKKGDVGPSKKISINLKNCTSNLSSINYSFNGYHDDIDPNILKINDKNGSSDKAAQGLGIEILDGKKNPVMLGQELQLNTSDNQVKNLDFYLRLKSTKDIVTSGEVSSILYLDVFYE